jgi:REP element-mobilizing transposase RayT
MTLPRRAQVSLAETPYYHCIARCVRRAFLCGTDAYSGQDFEHRKQWLLDRIEQQAGVFAIDICAYAIMSNHYHLVLRVDRNRALNCSDGEVVERWTRLFKGPILVQRMQAGDTLSPAQQQTVSEIIAVWRRRLADISWYMRCLNEFIARQANTEDACTGRFWEGRFKSQALLDHASVLSCMAYVDLNPVRAGIARTPEEADFTSIQARLASLCEGRARACKHSTGVPLLPFSGVEANPGTTATLPFRLKDYLELVAFTGRGIVDGKSCAIPDDVPRLLGHLRLSPTQWDTLSRVVHGSQLKAVGSLDRLRRFSLATGRLRMIGAGMLKQVYN